MLQISQNLTVSYLILLHSLAWPGLATNLWAKRSTIGNMPHCVNQRFKDAKWLNNFIAYLVVMLKNIELAKSSKSYKRYFLFVYKA